MYTFHNYCTYFCILYLSKVGYIVQKVILAHLSISFPENMRAVYETYSVKNDTYKIIAIHQSTTLVVNVTDIDTKTMHFLIFQAHSQNRYIILSYDL